VRWKAIRHQFEKGKGSELKSKFRAAYSSAALAVNAFAPLASIALPAIELTGDLMFEQERSAWAQGFKPTLDVTVEPSGSGQALFVESKCVEYLRASTTDFSPAFVRVARKRLRPEAAALYSLIHDDEHAFGRVDARQLLKHFLAAKRFATERSCRVTVLYCFWEPSDASEHKVFAEHRATASRLAESLPDKDVDLVAIPYPELWALWLDRGTAKGEHIDELRLRYGVSVGGLLAPFAD